jgi:pimeloyl-ACP methyl ester carboxylesterase
MNSWSLSRRFCSSQGHISWDVLGEGPPMVLVHGTPSWSYIWRNVAPRLAKGFQVFVYDLAGYGLSEQREDQDIRIRTHAKTLAELLRHWDVQNPHLVGHDFGGTTVMGAHLVERMAVASITVADAVVLNPWGTPYAALVRANPQVFAALPRYVHLAIVAAHLNTAIHKRTTRQDLAPYLSPWESQAGQRAYVRTYEQFDYDYTVHLENLYPKIRVPIHVIWGEHDRWLDPSVGRHLHELIPDSRLTIVPDGGHFVTEDAPGAVATAIESFCRERKFAD